MTAFDDLFLLRAFIAIVDAGNISAGARRLKIPQPTLSRHLRTLEERAATTLIRRDTHGMNLTRQGRRFLEDARDILTRAEEAEQRLRDDQTNLGGHLQVFATIDCGQAVVTRLISAFLQLHPKVTISLGLTNRPLHLIQEGCDVGILPGKITDENVIARPAGMITLSLAAAPSFLEGRRKPKSPTDLASWPWIALAGHQFWSSREIKLISSDGGEQMLPISPILVSEGVTSTMEAARSGLGVTVLPDWLMREDLAAGRLVRILPKWRTRDLPIHVVYANHRILPARVSAFIDFAVDYMKEELKPSGSKR